MKAIFILSDNIYLTPYIKFYIDILKKLNVEFDVVYWDKNDNEIISDANYFRFHYKSKCKIEKIFGYLKFRLFVKKIIEKNKYNLIIPLHMTVYLFINNFFVNRYKGRYIFDVRDYSYEKYSFFQSIEKKLANNSLINIISSKGFLNFLPENEYFIHHNFSYDDYKEYKQYNNPNEKIELSFIGLIRFMEQNKKIINYFANDDRFHLNFIGTNSDELKEYCEKNSINNVSCVGTFNSKDTLKYYNSTDGIMNMYGNNSKLLEYALSNKLYYSAVLYKPILVSKNTYMEELTKKYNLGIAVDLYDKSKLNDIYNYYIHLDRNKYINDCNNFIDKVIKEQNITREEIIKRINKFIKE